MKKNAFTFLFLISLIFFGCSKSENDGPGTGGELPPPDPTAILSIASENNSSSLNFGDVVANSEKTMAITLGNTGNSTLTITDINWPEGFSGDWTSGDIPSNGQRTINVTFSPLDQTTYSGSLAVVSNATTTPPNFPMSGKGISDVYDGNLVIESQSELESFIAMGYKHVINGTLTISGNSNSIVSLEPLSNLVSVKQIDIWGTDCESLTGIENLIVGSIQIIQNHNLTSLEGFPHATESIIGISIYENENLVSIAQLSDYTSLSYLSIRHNRKLENLEGLNNITSILLDLNLNDNILIKDLDPLANLSQVSGDIYINDNEALYDFCGLNPLVSSGNFQGFISTVFNRYNPTFAEILDGQCQYEVPLGEYYGGIRISNQTILDKYASKEYVLHTGKFQIIDNFNSITDLSGLNTLQFITGELTISSNTLLTNLDGLNNLNTVEGGIYIDDNSQLTNFCAIVPLIQGGNYPWYTATNNLYNPTEIELQGGTCEP